MKGETKVAKKQEVELSKFDCEELLNAMKERELNNQRLERLAGEIKRKNRIVEELLDVDKELEKKVEITKQLLKDRYTLVDEYDWNIDLDTYKATGVLKEEFPSEE